MTLNFQTITEARQHLIDNGYAFAGHGLIKKTAEIYEAGPMVAILTKVPFKVIKVTIK